VPPATSIAVADLSRWIDAPASDEAATPCELDEARRFVHDWTRRHQENFPVLTALVPPALRDDFAAVYAFCRAADDLGDEAGSPERATALLAWWRADLERTFDDAAAPRHPVFVALRSTARRRGLSIEPFRNLLDAFESDQRVSRYETWEQVIGYCRLSADPVGRIVLRLFGAPEDREALEASDAICTGLQLANHWQDIRRDLVERNRIYVPADLIAGDGRPFDSVETFESRLRRSIELGHGADREFMPSSRRLVQDLVERTWPCFERGRELLERLPADARPVIELFVEGGELVLRRLEAWDFESVLHRPAVGRLAKAGLVARAWVRSRLAARSDRRP
jgi:squalene synthase HpnC